MGLPSIGPMELVVILVIALLVIGPKKLPEMGKSIGRGMKEFKEGVSGGGDRHDRDELGFDERPAERTTSS